MKQNEQLDLDGLVRQLGLHQRRKVVEFLLAGNDTQCFSTNQYAEAYHRICCNDDPAHKENWLKYLMSLTPAHMRSVGMTEVRPGVWARVEPTEELL